jgi:hypothetical protein
LLKLVIEAPQQNARPFDRGQSEFGRFIQQDPIGDGVNWYAYAGNNPVRWVDPEGLWGVGVNINETTDVGAVIIGAGQTGALGAGVFGGGLGGINAGGLAAWGGFGGGPGWGRAYPSHPCSRPHPHHAALGAYAGGGINLFLTNAMNAEQLSGVASAVSINAGWKLRVFGAQFSWARGMWMLSYGGPPMRGFGFGAAASMYETHTWADTWIR